MTLLLEQALEKVRGLSTAEQDAIASIILQELEDERSWDEAFARSQDKLAAMAQKVRGDIHAGRTRNLGIDEL